MNNNNNNNNMCIFVKNENQMRYKRNSTVKKKEDKDEIHVLKTDKLNCSHAHRKKELLRHIVRLAGRIKRPEAERIGKR